MQPSDLVPLIELLPPDWRNTAIAVLAFLGSMTVAVNVMRSAVVPRLERWAQKTDAKWDNVWVARFAIALSVTAKVAAWAQGVFEVLGAHRLPKVRSVKALGLLLFFAIGTCIPLQSCGGPNAIRVHATIADTSYPLVMSAKQTLEERASADLSAIIASPDTPQDRDRRISALRDSYRPVEGAMNFLIVAYNAYVDAIQAAHAGHTDVRMEAAKELLRRWRALLELAGALGLELPEPPAALQGAGR